MYNAAQILLALLGLAGAGWFVLNRLFRPEDQDTFRSRTSQTALFLGLAAWLGMVLMRRDVVAATGLMVAMVLLWRYFRAR